MPKAAFKLKIKTLLTLVGFTGLILAIVGGVLFLQAGDAKPESSPGLVLTAATATTLPTPPFPALSRIETVSPGPVSTVLVPPLVTAPKLPMATSTAFASATPAYAVNLAAIEKSLQSLPGTSAASVLLPDGKLITRQADLSLPSASVIKLWIAAAVYEESRAGRLNLNENYLIKAGDIASGTGILGENIGKSYSYDQLIELMLIYSDNSAANLLINKNGGLAKINDYIQRNDYHQTKIQRYLGDVSNTANNFTSSRDCALYLERLLKGQIVDPTSSERIRASLRRRPTVAYDKPYNYFGRRLPAGLSFLHLSGTFPRVRNDVGILELKPGVSVIVAILSSEVDEANAEEAIAASVFQISQAVKS